MRQMRNNEASLVRNHKELSGYKEEVEIVNSLERNHVRDDANTWRDLIKRNESMCKSDSKELKSKIANCLEELNEIRKNRRK